MQSLSERTSSHKLEYKFNVIRRHSMWFCHLCTTTEIVEGIQRCLSGCCATTAMRVSRRNSCWLDKRDLILALLEMCFLVIHRIVPSELPMGGRLRRQARPGKALRFIVKGNSKVAFGIFDSSIFIIFLFLIVIYCVCFLTRTIYCWQQSLRRVVLKQTYFGLSHQ